MTRKVALVFAALVLLNGCLDNAENQISGSSGGSNAGTAGVASTPQAGSAGSTAGIAGQGGAASGSGGASGAGACSEGLLLCDPLAAFPSTIKETGLFASPPDFSKRSERLKLFAPSMPLWSDGLRKARYILLPKAGKIDTTDRAKWQFPIGTILVKTFSDDGLTGADHPLETRLIRKVSESEYEYAVYIWNAAGTEAALAKNENDQRVPVKAQLSGRGTFEHEVPSQYDCLACHRENARLTGSAFIGFDEVRLNAKLETSASQTQLEEFSKLGYFTGTLPEKAATIADGEARLQQVKRFVFGNCVHCHNGQRIIDFRPDVFVQNTVNQAPDASGIEVPKGYLRVVPGKPENSVVYLQTRRTGLPEGMKPMPPVGVLFAPDPEVENLKLWIQSLN